MNNPVIPTLDELLASPEAFYQYQVHGAGLTFVEFCKGVLKRYKEVCINISV